MTSQHDMPSDRDKATSTAMILGLAVPTVILVIGFAMGRDYWSSALAVAFGTGITIGLSWILYNGKIHSGGRSFGRDTAIYWFAVTCWSTIGLAGSVAFYFMYQ